MTLCFPLNKINVIDILWGPPQPISSASSLIYHILYPSDDSPFLSAPYVKSAEILLLPEGHWLHPTASLKPPLAIPGALLWCRFGAVALVPLLFVFAP